MGDKEGPKARQMREMREARWKEAQQAARHAPPPPKFTEEDVTTLDNEPSTREVERVARATKEKVAPKKAPSSKLETALAAMSTNPRRKPEPGEGRCVECGKIRAVRNGKIVAHQKGLGKTCPGSRKEPE